MGQICFMYCLEYEDKELIYKNCPYLPEVTEREQAQMLQTGTSVSREKVKLIDDIAFIQKRNQDKKKRGRSLFDIKKADKTLGRVADRVSSLFPYLLDFYLFLQNWGLEQDDPTQLPRYTHKKAFEKQKDINNHINQLHQSLENLEDFLNKEGQQLKFIQKILLDNGIINIIVQILKLCHFQIYGNQKDSNESEESDLPNALQKRDIPDRSAQKIAQSILVQKNAISKLYDILYKCIKGNSICCASVLSVENQYLQFFL